MKYKILKIPINIIYSTWNGATKQMMELQLCGMEQGYEDFVLDSVFTSYRNQAIGYYNFLIDLIASEEPVGDGYI